ncbi:MAG: hypothetical protein PHC35_01500 [Deltaproteobacteria bacterium]|jgi:hypothetical protein|nr:hypothetical protein [Deltaproteobacteria bacterium]
MKKKLMSLVMLVCSLWLTNAIAAGIPAGFVAQDSSSMYVVLVNFNSSQYTVNEVNGYMNSLKNMISSLLSDSTTKVYAFSPTDLAAAGLGNDADALNNQLVPGAVASPPAFSYVYIKASKVSFLSKTNLRLDIYIYSSSAKTGQYIASIELPSDLVASLSGS